MRCATRTGLVTFTVLLIVFSTECLGIHEYPRVVNVYYGDITLEQCEILSKWDILCLSSSFQDNDPGIIDSLRSRNPDIKILAYFPACFVWTAYDSMSETAAALGHKIAECDWWLYDTKGNKTGRDGYLWYTNLSTKCPPDESGRRIDEWLADYFAAEIISTGLWDGVLIDGLFLSPNWINNWEQSFADPPAMIDINRDGLADDPDSAYAWWQPTVESFVARLRQHIGYSYILIGNDKNYMSAYLNGGIRENFPYMHGGWFENMFADYGYLTQCEQWLSTPMNCPLMLCYWNDEDNTREAPDRTPSYERFLRFTLTSALLGDGYYLLAGGPEYIWWEDYYDLDLGAPTSEVYLDSIWNDIYDCFNSLWKREFENATVICNPSDDWIILEDGTWLSPRDGRIETRSIPPGMGIDIVKQGAERSFDQEDTSFGCEVSINNPSQHSAFVYTWAKLSRNGDVYACGSPRRFLIGAAGSDAKRVGVRTNSTMVVGTYTLEVFVAGPDCVAVDTDTLLVERIIRRGKEPVAHTDTGGQPNLMIYPDPVVSTSSLSMQLSGGNQNGDLPTVIRLYDVRGRLVSKVFDGQLKSGQALRTSLETTGQRPLSPGIYLLHAEIGDQELAKKIVVVR